MIELALLSIAPVLLAICVILLLFTVTADFRFGIGIVLFEFILEAWRLAPPGFSLWINLFASDAVFLALAFAVVVRVLLGQLNSAIQWLWLGFGLVLVISFVSGVLTYQTAAGVEFRQYFYLWTGVMYCLVMPLSERQTPFIRKALTISAVFLILIACYRWSVGAFGLGPQPWLEESENSRFRVLNANQALFLSQLLIVGIAYHFSKAALGVAKSWHLGGLVLVIVILQHRTVWLVTIASLTIFLIADSNLRRSARQYALHTIILLLFAAPILLASSVFDTLYHAAVVEPFSQRSTMMWRIESWLSTITDWVKAGPKEWLIGFPFGRGYYRYLEVQRAYVDTYPHSYYVTTLLRTGVAGMFFMITAHLIALRYLLSSSCRVDEKFSISNLVAVLLCGQLVFYATYNPGFIQAIVLGLSLRFALSIESSAVRKTRIEERVRGELYKRTAGTH